MTIKYYTNQYKLSFAFKLNQDKSIKFLINQLFFMHYHKFDKRQTLNREEENTSKSTLTNHTNNHQKISLKNKKVHNFINTNQNNTAYNHNYSNDPSTNHVSEASSIHNFNANMMKSPDSRSNQNNYKQYNESISHFNYQNSNVNNIQAQLYNDSMQRSIGISKNQSQIGQKSYKNNNMLNSLPSNLSSGKNYIQTRNTLNLDNKSFYLIKTPSHSPYGKKCQKQTNLSFNNSKSNNVTIRGQENKNKIHTKKHSNNELQNRYVYTYVPPQKIQECQNDFQYQRRLTVLSPKSILQKQKEKQLNMLRRTQPGNKKTCNNMSGNNVNVNLNNKTQNKFFYQKGIQNGNITQIKYIKPANIVGNQLKKSHQIKSGTYVKIQNPIQKDLKGVSTTLSNKNQLFGQNVQKNNNITRKYHKPMSSFDKPKPQFQNQHFQHKKNTFQQSDTVSNYSHIQKYPYLNHKVKTGMRSTLNTQAQKSFKVQSCDNQNIQKYQLHYQMPSSGQSKYSYPHTYNSQTYQNYGQFSGPALQININSPQQNISNLSHNQMTKKIVTAFSPNQKNVLVNKNYFFGNNDKDRPIQQNKPKRSIKKMLNQPNSRPQLSEVLISLKYSDLSKNIKNQKQTNNDSTQENIFDFSHSKLGRFFCSTFKINTTQEGCECDPKCIWMDRWMSQMQKQQYKKSSLLKNNFLTKVKKLGLVHNLFDFGEEIYTENSMQLNRNLKLREQKSTANMKTVTNLKSSTTQNDSSTLKQIQKDIPRTYSDHPTFKNSRYQQMLKQLLINFYTLDKQLGYVQGMNIIAANLIYHSKTSYQSLKMMDFIMNTLNYRCLFQNDMRECKLLSKKTANFIKTYCFDMYSYVVYENQIQLQIFIIGWYFSMLGSFVPLQKMHLVINKFIKKSFIGLAQIIVTYFICIKEQLMQKQDENQIMQELSMQQMIQRSKSINWQQLVASSYELNLSKL